MDRDELIAALTDRLSRVTSRLETYTESSVDLRDAVLALTRALTELTHNEDDRKREIHHELKQIGERLAKIELLVGIVQRDHAHGEAAGGEDEPRTPTDRFALPGGVAVEVKRAARRRWENAWRVAKLVYVVAATLAAVYATAVHWLHVAAERAHR